MIVVLLLGQPRSYKQDDEFSNFPRPPLSQFQIGPVVTYQLAYLFLDEFKIYCRQFWRRHVLALEANDESHG